MKTAFSTIAKAVALVAFSLASNFATAAGTSTLAVTASVTGTCKFAAVSTPLGFGAIDPSSILNALATASVLYRCTNGTASLGITAPAGARAMNTTPPNLTPLSYTLSISGGTSTGTGFGGAALTATVAGTITPAQFQNVIAGPYSENVTLSITP